jgi:hypothetical protein
MASSRPWPFDDDEDRPSGSVRPLSQADLQAILAHLGDDPDQLLADSGADRPVVALRGRASVGFPGASAHAEYRRRRAVEWLTPQVIGPGGLLFGPDPELPGRLAAAGDLEPLAGGRLLRSSARRRNTAAGCDQGGDPGAVDLPRVPQTARACQPVAATCAMVGAVGDEHAST